jgi:predicted DNA-binding transcriptional regulator YafY
MSVEQREALEAGLRQAAFPPESDISEQRRLLRELTAGNHVPVQAATGRRGGYVIDKARTLPPLNFTAAEMLAMPVSLAGTEATPVSAPRTGKGHP